MIEIRQTDDQDFEAIWEIFHEVVSRGDTYAFDPNTNKMEAHKIWLETPTATYIATKNDQIVGTYYIKPNFAGPGSHVCNAGFMVHPSARGKGVGKAMGQHALTAAKTLGFLAMQFNMVVSTNTVAVNLWKSLGFSIIGTIPKAFNHKKLGFVDAFVMYQWLE
jgi:L-amino acid N-acyltransferase YncA